MPAGHLSSDKTVELDATKQDTQMSMFLGGVGADSMTFNVGAEEDTKAKKAAERRTDALSRHSA